MVFSVIGDPLCGCCKLELLSDTPRVLLLPQESALSDAVAEIERLEAQLVQNPVYQSEKDNEKFSMYVQQAALQRQADELRAKLRHSQLSSFREEAKWVPNLVKVLP